MPGHRAQEVRETTARMQQFKALPLEEKAFNIDFKADYCCNAGDAKELFLAVCRGTSSQQQENSFFQHIERCDQCYATFLELIWLCTDYDDGH